MVHLTVRMHSNWPADHAIENVSSVKQADNTVGVQ